MNDTPWIEARTLDLENVRETFALAARHVLADVAGEYHAVITVAELAHQVQERTRLRTRQAPGLWVGDILFRVAKDCRRRNEPLLGALCVGPDGQVPEWYADTVNAVRGDIITDPQMHAAEERLDCYRLHGADIPPGGGEAALPPVRESVRRAPRVSVPGTRTRTPATPRTPRKAAAPKVLKPAPPAEKLCPDCFMVLPSTGLCDNCD